MEKNRCSVCGEIYGIKEQICPACGSKEKSKIAMPSPDGWDA